MTVFDFSHLRDRTVDIDKLRSVGIGAAAVPSRRGAVVGSERLEARWADDMPAYKRLKEDGLQPPRIDGCAQVEARASERHEVEGTPSPKAFEIAGNL